MTSQNRIQQLEVVVADAQLLLMMVVAVVVVAVVVVVIGKLLVTSQIELDPSVGGCCC